MARFLKSRQPKHGASPGTLVHIGERRHTDTVVTLMTYDADSCVEQQVDVAALGDTFDREAGIRWINVEGVTQVDVLKRIGDTCGLHPLVMEDIVNTDQRPKMEEYGGYLFIVMKKLDVDDESGKISVEQVSLLLGNGWLLTVQEGLGDDPFQQVRERLHAAKGRIREAGADYLAYALLDTLVDQYFTVLERLTDRVELLEEEVVTLPTRFTMRKMHRLRQEMIQFRKSVWPTRELVGGLERRDSELISEGTQIYLRDLYDHTVQIVETVETARETIRGMLDIYLSSEANRTNEVMKVLTVYATIFMPLTFIVGLYGMNFKYMPELGWRWGYPAVLVIMALLALGMIIYFRRKKWLGK